jgi:hypothetical protein
MCNINQIYKKYSEKSNDNYFGDNIFWVNTEMLLKNN